MFTLWGVELNTAALQVSMYLETTSWNAVLTKPGLQALASAQVSELNH